MFSIQTREQKLAKFNEVFRVLFAHNLSMLSFGQILTKAKGHTSSLSSFFKYLVVASLNGLPAGIFLFGISSCLNYLLSGLGLPVSIPLEVSMDISICGFLAMATYSGTRVFLIDRAMSEDLQQKAGLMKPEDDFASCWTENERDILSNALSQAYWLLEHMDDNEKMPEKMKIEPRFVPRRT